MPEVYGRVLSETTSVKKRGKEELTRGRRGWLANTCVTVSGNSVRSYGAGMPSELSQTEVGGGRWFASLCRYLDMGFPWGRGTVLGKETSFRWREFCKRDLAVTGKSSVFLGAEVTVPQSSGEGSHARPHSPLQFTLCFACWRAKFTPSWKSSSEFLIGLLFPGKLPRRRLVGLIPPL